MTSTLAPFSSVEETVKNLLEARFPQLAEDGHVRRDFNDVESNLPYANIVKIGGQRTKQEDFPVVDIDIFAATQAETETWAEQIDAFLLGGERRIVVGGRVVVVDTVLTNVSPRQLPWADSGVRRFGMTYNLVLRRASGGVGTVPLLQQPFEPVIVGSGPPDPDFGQPGWLYIDSLTGNWYTAA